MDGFNTILFVAVVTGIVVVIIALFGMARGGRSGSRSEDGSLKKVEDSIKEADEAVEELNKLAGNVMAELEGKYKEVLFLYNLIDEKKQELYSQYGSKAAEKPKSAESIRPMQSVVRPTQSVIKPTQSAIKPKPGTKQLKNIHHPMKNEILKLHEQRLPVADIAKTLSIGQGEVSLVLELMGRG